MEGREGLTERGGRDGKRREWEGERAKKRGEGKEKESICGFDASDTVFRSGGKLN